MKSSKDYRTKAVPIGLDKVDQERIAKEIKDAKKEQEKKASSGKEKKAPKKKSEKKVKKNG